MSTSPYAAAPEFRLKETIRLAENRLSAQLTVGLAADQRAMTFASFLATLEAAAIAAMLVVPKAQGGWWALVVLVVGFGAATLCALWSAQPVAWDIPGYPPHSWLEEIAGSDTEHDDMAAIAQHYDEALVDNERLMMVNANWLRVAMLLIALSLLMAAIVAGVAGLS